MYGYITTTPQIPQAVFVFQFFCCGANKWLTTVSWIFRLPCFSCPLPTSAKRQSPFHWSSCWFLKKTAMLSPKDDSVKKWWCALDGRCTLCSEGTKNISQLPSYSKFWNLSENLLSFLKIDFQILAFSIRSTYRYLMRPNKRHLNSLHGIRVLSALWVNFASSPSSSATYPC